LDARPELLRYLKHGHKFVSGWLIPEAVKMVVALAKAQDTGGIKGNIAEIGVHHGKLFILLSLFTRDGEKAVAIDLFADQARNVDHSGSGDLDKFQENVKRHADSRRVVVYQGDSTELTAAALVNLGGAPFRLISVDGGHTPEITAHDLTTAEGALAPGGIIILDDCFNQQWPGVSEGVHRHFSGIHRAIIPFATGGNKTLFCAPEYASHYIDILRVLPTKAAMQDFLGYRILCCDFKPLSFHERVGQNTLWQSVKDFGAVKLARGAYHHARAVIGR
jgi:predicted O-methyltransferase YrrM